MSLGADRIGRRPFLVSMATGAVATSIPGRGTLARPAPSQVDELTSLSAGRLAAMVRDRQVTAAEVVDVHLRRIDAVNGPLHAVVRLVADRAREEARACDRRLAAGEQVGRLHGVPMTIKDSFDTEGVVSTAGVRGRARFVPDRDATVVRRLRDEGAILLGKTNTPELTLSFETVNPVYGETRNPYDRERSPGGSSGGAAAIVAAGGAPFDLGSDTAGSIRVPAHFCGIAGLKPTSGRVPRTGHIISFDTAFQSLTHVGPLARSVADLDLIGQVIHGPDGVDPHIAPVAWRDWREVDLRTLRVAYFLDNGIAEPTRDTRRIVEEAAAHLGSVGAGAGEVRLDGIEESMDVLMALAFADGAAWVRRLLERTDTRESALAEAGGEAVEAGELTGRLEELDRLRSRALRVWDEADVLVCPVNGGPAPRFGTADGEMRPEFSYTMMFSLTGWPVVVVRCGESADGLPIGVQVVAPPWREDLALATARELEDRFGGWHPPPVE